MRDRLKQDPRTSWFKETHTLSFANKLRRMSLEVIQQPRKLCNRLSLQNFCLSIYKLKFTDINRLITVETLKKELLLETL